MDSTPAKLLHKCLDIDETARVAALADPPLLVESLDLEPDQAPLDRNHARSGAHRCAHRRGGEVTNIDLGADRDPPRLQTGFDGIVRGPLHLQDHHWRRIDHRHVWDEMTDGALGRYDQPPLRAHADLDDVACVHELLSSLSPRGRGWRNRPKGD